MKKRILLSLIVLLVTTSSTLAANIIEIGPAGQYSTIQAGIDAADSGDTVLIHPGTYTGDGNRDIDLTGKPITVRSIDPNDPCFVAATIIDCNGTEEEPHRGFNFSNNQDCNAVIDGLTIINGCVPDGGGAIDCNNNQQSTLLISNCNINNNKVVVVECELWECDEFVGGGGAIDCRNNQESALVISNCNINNNKVILECETWFCDQFIGGGGISVTDGSYLINNCNISDNLTEGSGGAVCSLWGSNLEISNSTITRNSALRGGGINFGGGINVPGSQVDTLTISNCNITNNKALEGTGRGAFGLGGGISVIDGICLLNNCTISANSAKDAGGGIYCGGDVDLTISNCKISENQASWSGGLLVRGSAAAISNCKISENQAIYGGGIVFSGGINVMNNCIISGNKAQDGDGGGIFDSSDFLHTNLIMNNCTIYANIAGRYGGGVYGSYGTQHYSSMNNIIVWDNEALYGQGMHFIRAGGDGKIPPVSYSNIQGGWEGTGNIDIDPCFVEPGLWDTNGTPEDVNDDILIEGDYHLLPGSLCIDTGDPCYVPAPNETDLDGNPRITGGRIDMGAYESDYIQAHLWLLPRTINRQSKMKRVMAWMKLPEGITKNQIDEDAPLLLYPGPLEPINQYFFEHGKKGDKRTNIFILYDKAELMSAVPDNGLVDVQVIGSLNTGQQFYGTSFINILDRQQPRQWRLLKNK